MSYKVIFNFDKSKHKEITIESSNLLYSEIGSSYSGCQSLSKKNNDLIHEKCRKIADLFRQIEDLNF